MLCNETDTIQASLTDVSELEKKYQGLLESYNVSYSPHVSRFIEKLKQGVAGLIDHTVGRKKYVFVKSKLVE